MIALVLTIIILVGIALHSVIRESSKVS